MRTLPARLDCNVDDCMKPQTDFQLSQLSADNDENLKVGSALLEHHEATSVK